MTALFSMAGTCFAGTTFGDITISPRATPMCESSHGYLDHTFDIENASPTKPHHVRLVLWAERDWDGIRRLAGSAVVGPRGTVALRVLQPPINYSSSGRFAVYIDGRREREEVALPYNLYTHMTQNSQTTPTVLTSRGINSQAFRENYFKTLHGIDADAADRVGKGYTTSSGYHPKMQTLPKIVRSEEEAARWSEQWLSYSRFDSIVLTADEFGRLPAGARDALWRHAECGGTLVVFGSMPPPQTWQRMKLERIPEGLETYTVGFGTYLNVPNVRPEDLPKPALSWMESFWRRSTLPWSTVTESGGANSRFPVILKYSVPIRGILALMVLFAILAGPLNVFLLARKNRRIWLLWTTPALSAATSILVIAHILFAEGITPLSRTAGITVLDEGARRAVTLGMTAFYCPLALSDGLRFQTETEVTPCIPRDVHRYARRSRTQRSLDWTQDQHLSDGWVAARVPAHFALRHPSQQTERIQILGRENGVPLIVNGLGCDIEQLWLADWDGNVYEGTALDAGGKFALTPGPAGAKANGSPGTWTGIYTTSKWLRIPVLDETCWQQLMPGTYVAKVKGCPFLETGLKRRTKHKEHGIVYGIMAKDSHDA